MVGVGIVGEASGFWDGVVVESGDVPELEGQVDGGLAVGREEAAVLSGMLIRAHGNVEGLLDGGDGSCDVEVDAIGRGGDDGEAVLPGEIDDGVVVVLGGAEFRGELIDGEEATVRGTGWVVEIVEEGVEFRLIAEWESEDEAEVLGGGQLSESFRFAGDGGLTDVMGEEGLLCRSGQGGGCGERDRND